MLLSSGEVFAGGVIGGTILMRKSNQQSPITTRIKTSIKAIVSLGFIMSFCFWSLALP